MRKFYVKERLFAIGAKFDVYDENMREIATIKKEFMVPEYDITGSVGVMNMESSSILGRSYEIKRNGEIIGRIDKEFTFGRDRYFLEVIDESYTKFFIGLLIMIDMIRFHNDN